MEQLEQGNQVEQVAVEAVVDVVKICSKQAGLYAVSASEGGAEAWGGGARRRRSNAPGDWAVRAAALKLKDVTSAACWSVVESWVAET